MLNKLYIFLVLLMASACPQTYLTENFNDFLRRPGDSGMDSLKGMWLVGDTMFHVANSTTLLTDLSGNGNTLTANIVAYLDSLVAPGANPLYSGGNNGTDLSATNFFSIAAASATDFDFTTSFSFEIWQREFAPGAVNLIAKRKNAAAFDGYLLYWNLSAPNKHRWLPSDGTGSDLSTDAWTGYGTTWHQFVVTHSSAASGSNTVKMYRDGVLVKTHVNARNPGNSSAYNFYLYANQAGAGSATGYGLLARAWHAELNANQVLNLYALARGWEVTGNDLPGVARVSYGFHQGIVADTVYYNTAITTGRWKVTVNVDGAAGGESLKVLTSADKSTWSAIGTITATTDATNYIVTGTGLGYIGFGLTSGTVYIDDLTVENNPISKPGLSETRKLNTLRSLK